jgi:hypothetical protein
LPRQVYLLLIKPAFAGRTLQPFRCLHDCSGCFRLERLPGGPCTHWKAPPFHGAHPKRSATSGKAAGQRTALADAACCNKDIATKSTKARTLAAS